MQRGRIAHTPKPVVDRATAEGLEDVRKGRVRGPFNTVDEMIDSLKGRRRQSLLTQRTGLAATIAARVSRAV